QFVSHLSSTVLHYTTLFRSNGEEIPMLEIKNIYKTFNPGTINEKLALDGLSLTLKEGDFVTVIGGNGAGKSTMLNAVAGTRLVKSKEHKSEIQSSLHLVSRL